MSPPEPGKGCAGHSVPAAPQAKYGAQGQPPAPTNQVWESISTTWTSRGRGSQAPAALLHTAPVGEHSRAHTTPSPNTTAPIQSFFRLMVGWGASRSTFQMKLAIRASLAGFRFIENKLASVKIKYICNLAARCKVKILLGLFLDSQREFRLGFLLLVPCESSSVQI